MASVDLIIKTERLILRTWREQDELVVVRHLMDADFMQFSPSGALGEAQARARFKQLKQQAEVDPHGAKLAIALIETQELIGYCGLEAWELQGEPTLELGFRLFASARAKGYAHEAASALLDCYGAQGIKSIHAFTYSANLPSITYSANLPSIKLLNKLGFVQITSSSSAAPAGIIYHRQTQ